MGRENQLVGAFGERAVEAELLRRRWLTSNVNSGIKNAADYDIFALKGKRTVHLRIKTCGPRWNAFQFGGFRPGWDISARGFSKTDYTILVRMGEDREGDAFYVIPTAEVRKRISISRADYLNKRKRDGGKRKDLGHWSLLLNEARNGEDRSDHGFARKWKRYLNAWASLEGRREARPCN